MTGSDKINDSSQSSKCSALRPRLLVHFMTVSVMVHAHLKRAEWVVHVVLPLKEEWAGLGPWVGLEPWAGLEPWEGLEPWVASVPWVELEWNEKAHYFFCKTKNFQLASKSRIIKSSLTITVEPLLKDTSVVRTLCCVPNVLS